MKLRERIENHAGVVFLGAILLGFLAGVGTYDAVVRMARLEMVSQGRLDTLEAELTTARQQVAQWRRQKETSGQEDRWPVKEVSRSLDGQNGHLVDIRTSGPDAIANPPPPEERVDHRMDVQLSPDHRDTVDRIDFQFRECVQEEECVVCGVLAQSQNNTRKVRIYGSHMEDRSRVIDQAGIEHLMTRHELNQELIESGSIGFVKSIPEAVPVYIQTEYCGFEEPISELALLELGLVAEDHDAIRPQLISLPVRSYR